ncbi:DUF402 domain-containing protein [Corynebacterium kroppenstedtii]
MSKLHSGFTWLEEPTIHGSHISKPGYCANRISDHFRPETKASEPLTGRQEFYIDIAHNARDRERPIWTTTDYYADIVLYNHEPGADGRYSMEVLDLDELEDSYTQGFISAAELAHALSVTATVVDGLTTYGDIDSWLEQFNIALTWENPEDISLTPAP